MEMCKVLWFAVLEIVLVLFAQVSQCTQDMQNWRVHQRRIAGFPCSMPQPRSFRLKDIVEDKDLPDDFHVDVFPRMTVLHRCDSQSGCCNGNKVCAPQVTEDVSLTFRIVNKINKRHASSGPRERYLHVVATNHTYCSCQAEHDLPK